MNAMITEHCPDFIVMSETKLTDRLHGKSYVKECVPGYQLRYSSVPHPSSGEYRTRSDHEVSNRAGSAGVAIAFSDKHAHSGDPIVTIPSCSRHAHGHLQMSMVTPLGNGSQQLILGGVYMPCQDGQRQDVVIQQLQSTLAWHIRTLWLSSPAIGIWTLQTTD